MSIKITVTNTGVDAVRFFNAHADQQIDVAAGATAELELASGTALIAMTPFSEATQKSFEEFQRTGSLGGGGD